MIMISLAQTKESDECGSVKNDEILHLHLGSVGGLWVSIPCLFQNTGHTHWSLCPINQPTSDKKFWKRSNSQQIVSYCLRLHTQNGGLREVDLQGSPKRGNNKINRLKLRKKKTQQKTSHILQPGLTKQNLALREVHLEPTANWGTNRTEDLVSLWWSSLSLPLKLFFNKILHKLTLVDPIKSSWNSVKTNRIPKLHAVQHIKTKFTKSTNCLNAHEWS